MAPNEHAFEIVKIIRKPSSSIFTILIRMGSAVGNLVRCFGIHFEPTVASDPPFLFGADCLKRHITL